METEVISQELTNEDLKLPYLIFKIDDVFYAVNGETINTIFVLDQPVTRVPMTGKHVKGIINVRGEVVPLVDIRVMFEINTIEEEQKAFSIMLEKRRQDHLNWLDTLEDAIQDGSEFTLSRDHHKCKFGKWYDSYKPQTTQLQYIYNQIEEPHQKLHACAERALSAATCEEAKEIVRVAREEYGTKLLDLITQMEGSIGQSAAKQMVIILQKDKTQIGIIVDEVMEVTDIEEICTLDEVSNVHHSRFVRGVGNAEQYEKDILMIDVDQIVSIGDKSSATA